MITMEQRASKAHRYQEAANQLIVFAYGQMRSQALWHVGNTDAADKAFLRAARTQGKADAYRMLEARGRCANCGH